MDQVKTIEKSRAWALRNISFAWKVFAYALILAVAFSVISPVITFADEQSHRKLAEEVLVLANVERMMTPAFDELREKQMESFADIDYPGKSAEKDIEFKKRIADYLDEKISWNNLKDGYTEVFAGIFTEEELKVILDFYSSPAGKKFLSSATNLVTKLMKSTQTQLITVNRDLEQIKEDFVLEQEKQEKQRGIR